MTEPSEESQNHKTITGLVERVTFHSEETGYSVLRFRVQGEREPSVVVGNFSAISPGESLRLTGHWTTHPQYGQQFKAVESAVVRPATIAGIQKYLGSGLIKGIGPVTAKRIVEHFKEKTLEIIENDITRLSEVKGIARSKVEMIQRAWEEQRAIKEVMLFLQSHAVSTHHAVKIFKQYGNQAILIVEQTPYRLAVDVYGIGFRGADQIARNLGMPADAPERMKAGLRHTLLEASEEGHCYLPQGELVTRAAKALDVENEAKLAAATATMLDEGLLRIGAGPDEHAIYLPPFWQAERAVVRRLKLLLEKRVQVNTSRVESWLGRFTERRGIELSDEQQHAIQQATKERVLVLTGGPGTGKTTTLRTMVQLFEAMG
ncbi:MAG: helix-hairpin-helix domain-containing protein, partial [Blastocatellia bacterium]